MLAAGSAGVSPPPDMIASFILPFSRGKLGFHPILLHEGRVCTQSSVWTLELPPRASLYQIQRDAICCATSRITPHGDCGRRDLQEQRRPQQIPSLFASVGTDTSPDSKWDDASRSFAVEDVEGSATLASLGDTVNVARNDGMQQLPCLDSNEVDLLTPRLQAMLGVTKGKVMSMITSHPALLSLPMDGIDKIVNLMATLLAVSETEIITAVRKRTHLLLLGVDGLLQKKIEVLTEAGLSPAEVRTLLMTSPQHVMVSLEEIRRNVDFLREALDLDLPQVKKVIVGMPSILSLSSDLEDTRSFFIDDMQLSRQRLKLWVMRDPRILLSSASGARLKFVYFQEELGASRLHIVKLIEKLPQILTLDLERKIRPNVAYLRNGLDIPSGRLVGVLVAVPWLLWLDIDNTLKPKVRWLSVELMLRRDQLRKVILLHPQVLTLSLEKNLSPKTSWLKMTLQIDDFELRDMIVRHPALLHSNMETTIKPKMSFLRDEVGVEEERLRKLLVRTPAIFSYSIGTMRTKLSYFKEELQFNSQEITKVIAHVPQVLGYSVTSMASKVAFITQVLDTNKDETKKIIWGCPTILNLSIEKNLRLKFDLYLEELHGKPQDVRSHVVASPSILGYSMTKRIRPRMQVLRLLGIEPNFSDHIRHLTCYSSVRFKKWLEHQLMKSTGAERRGNIDVRIRMKQCLGILHNPGETMLSDDVANPKNLSVYTPGIRVWGMRMSN